MTLLIALAALVLDLALVLLIAPPAALTRCVVAAIPWVAAFRHLEPRRGRRPGTLAAAWILSAGASLATLGAWNAWSPRAIGAAAIAAVTLAPLPGHLLALLPRAAPALPHGPQIVHDPMARAVKRACDLVAIVLLGPPAIPVIAVAAVLVRATTPGPAFYSHTRITRGGRPFRIWKLRTMIADAERGKPVWPEEDDPRITRLGRVLRRMWIDELPQLWNVLFGDMSVIGPRPERPEFVEAFAASLPKYRERHAVSAGITGLAQVAGLIGNTSIRRRLSLDRRYIRVWTPGLDLWILARTAAKALRRARGEGAATRPGAPASGGGGSSVGLRGSARHLPERDQ